MRAVVSGARTAIVAVVGLAAATAWAEEPAAPPPAEPAFSGRLPARLRARMSVPVPLERDDDARLVLLNPRLLPDDPVDDDDARAAAGEAWALRRAGAGAAPGRRGTATRYRSPDKAVHGDGRLVYLDDVLIDRAAAPGRARDVQLSGIPTGLARDGLVAVDGEKLAQHMIEDAIMSEWLSGEGVPVATWLAGFDLGPWERGARAVRGGRFERIAHLLELDGEPATARLLIADVNRTVSARLGRRRPLSMVGLFQQLLEIKADELARGYWARVADPATYDNTALFQKTDLDRVSGVDRPHPGYAPGEAGPGLAGDAPFVLGRMYVGELRALLLAAAPTRERAALERFPAEAMARSVYYRKMAVGLLEHLGFDADVRRSVLRKRGPEVQRLLAVVLAIAHQAESGVSSPMGPEGEPVADPARYDAFAAIGELVAIATSRSGGKSRAARMARALAPVRPRAADDEATAARLLEAAAPIIDHALAGVSGAARTARASLFVAEARRINRPVEAMVRSHIRAVARDMVADLRAGVDPRLIEARIAELARQGRRGGPGSPGEVALAIRHGAAEEIEGGDRLRLTSHRQHGLRVEELTDLTDDALRVTLAVGAARLRGLALHVRVHGAGRGAPTSIKVAPSRVAEGRAIFELPLVDAGDRLELWFTAREGDPRAIPALAAGYRMSFAPALGSKLVQAELGRRAAQRGIARPQTSTELVKAVTGLAQGRRLHPTPGGERLRVHARGRTGGATTRTGSRR